MGRPKSGKTKPKGRISLIDRFTGVENISSANVVDDVSESGDNFIENQDSEIHLYEQGTLVANSELRKKRLSEFFRADDNGIKLLSLSELSIRPARALSLALEGNGIILKKDQEWFDFKNLENICVGDLLNIPNVGFGTFKKLIEELQCKLDELEGFEIDTSAQQIKSDISRSDLAFESDLLVQLILQSEKLEVLYENVFSLLLFIYAQESKREASESIRRVWRQRLPWICDEPMKIGDLSKQMGLSNSRINKIQLRGTQIDLSLPQRPNILTNVINLMLEVSSLEEFRFALLEEGFLDSVNFNLGRIRHLGIVLKDSLLVQEFESSVFRWNSMLSRRGNMELPDIE